MRDRSVLGDAGVCGRAVACTLVHARRACMGTKGGVAGARSVPEMVGRSSPESPRKRHLLNRNVLAGYPYFPFWVYPSPAFASSSPSPW
mmetsp:Transcript_1982/g.7415  ORF Transcript_1982/g.7415 Transcript_1982/m.7415 type:complete len:89 (+) Transcript_1982:1222-1488(+)